MYYPLYMKPSKAIFNFNYINPILTESEISDLKALYKLYYTKYWLFKMSYKHFKKVELACNISSLALTGSIVGSITLNPIALGIIAEKYLLNILFKSQTDICHLYLPHISLITFSFGKLISLQSCPCFYKKKSMRSLTIQ